MINIGYTGTEEDALESQHHSIDCYFQLLLTTLQKKKKYFNALISKSSEIFKL